MIATRRPSVGRFHPEGRASRTWLFLVAAALVLPAITSGEFVVLPVAGIDWNLRVAAYFGVAAVAAVVAFSTVVRMDEHPAWLYLMVAMLGWLTITGLLANQSPVEWVPTVVRFALYFSAATISYVFGRSLNRDQVLVTSRLLPLAILAAAAIPAMAGIAEFIRGSAPVINGAPRVSGSMPTHPVAYSLVLTLSALVTLGPALLRGRKLGGLLRWVAIAVLMALVFTTYTRLSILLLVACGVVVAVLLPGPGRVRLTRLAGTSLLAAAVVFLAQPTFNARFTYPTPLSEVISRSDPSPRLSPGPSPLANDDTPDIDVDGSVAYRVLLTQHGLRFLSQSPIIGHGPGSFDRLFEAESGRANVAAHNDVLSLAVETGLPGLMLYIFILGSVAWALRPNRPTGVLEADALIVTALVALGAINLGAAIHNPTYFVEIQLPVWILVGTALGIREQSWSVDRSSTEVIGE